MRSSSRGSLLNNGNPAQMDNPLDGMGGFAGAPPPTQPSSLSKDPENPLGYQPGYNLTKARNTALNVETNLEEEDPFKEFKILELNEEDH